MATVEPTNSIDSELEEILDWVAKMHTEKPRGWNDEMVTNIALKAIATKYVSRKEVEEANKILKIQGDNGNWNYDPYMHGLYNGMEMIVAIFERREPKFKKAPKKWLVDIKTAKLLPPTKGGNDE